MEDMEGTTSTVEAGLEKMAVRLRIRPPKRQTPSQRLKRRLYYRRNRTRIVMRRRRYLRTHKSLLKAHRKLFRRFKPKWMTKPRKPRKPSKTKKFRVSIPHMVRSKKPSFLRRKRPSFGIRKRRED